MRRRIECKPTFEERLIQEAQHAERRPRPNLPAALPENCFFLGARQAEAASHIDRWQEARVG
jgi:hypothetical protein